MCRLGYDILVFKIKITVQLTVLHMPAVRVQFLPCLNVYTMVVSQLIVHRILMILFLNICEQYITDLL